MLNGRAPETPIETLRRLVPKVGAHPLLPAEVRQALTAALGQMEVTERRLDAIERQQQAAAADLAMLEEILTAEGRSCDA